MEISIVKNQEKKTAGIAVNKTHSAGGASASPTIMEYASASDEQLIDLVSKQDQKAFKELFKRHSKKVFNLAYSHVNDFHYAEEIAEDVFLKVFKKAATFKKESSVSTWIYRITVNESITHIRKHKTDHILTNIENAEQIEEDVEMKTDPEKVKLGLRLLSGLPDNQKTAFILSQKDNLKYREISEIMKISEKAVEALVYRARENLRRSIKEVRSNEKLKEFL